MPKKSAEQKLAELYHEKGLEWIDSQVKTLKALEKKQGDFIEQVRTNPDHTFVVTGDGAK